MFVRIRTFGIAIALGLIASQAKAQTYTWSSPTGSNDNPTVFKAGDSINPKVTLNVPAGQTVPTRGYFNLIDADMQEVGGTGEDANTMATLGQEVTLSNLTLKAPQVNETLWLYAVFTDDEDNILFETYVLIKVVPQTS